MITLKELNPRNLELTPDQADNLKRHHANLQKFRGLYGKPMIVSGGLRDWERHRDIYVLRGTPESRIPRGSRHLVGYHPDGTMFEGGDATDFADPGGEMGKFCLDNPHVLVECGLYIESPAYTVIYDAEGNAEHWLHMQSMPPRSGKHVFQPFPGPPPQAPNFGRKV